MIDFFKNGSLLRHDNRLAVHSALRDSDHSLQSSPDPTPLAPPKNEPTPVRGSVCFLHAAAPGATSVRRPYFPSLTCVLGQACGSGLVGGQALQLIGS